MNERQTKPQPEQDDLYWLQSENRHLKDTIIALRQEIERLRIEHDENLQKALSAASDEIGQLKVTIGVLRDKLERERISHEEKIQEINRLNHHEMIQLQQTIQTLRELLEGDNEKQPSTLR